MDAWYYSTGGRQNGPVSLDELRRLYATGTVAPKDQVWREGMADWKAAEDVPELKAPAPVAPASRADGPSNPYAAPAAERVSLGKAQDGSLTEIVPGSQPLDPGAIFRRAFELTKRHFWMLLGVFAVCWVASFVFQLILAGAVFPFRVKDASTGITGLSMVGLLVQFVLTVAFVIFASFLSMGLTRICLNVASGKPFDFGMLFGEAGKLPAYIGASIIFGVAVGIGSMLLIVPGIYVALRFGQYQFAIVDKNLGAIESLQYSAKITEGNKMNLFVLGLIAFLIVLAGMLVLIVGAFFAIPMVVVASMIAYRWLQYGQAAVLEQAPAQR